ncbi:MAG: SH3 domain-containing protein [Cyanobacteria bacterium J06638_20]
MKSQTLLMAALASLTTVTLASPGRTDTVNAHCDFYPAGSDTISMSTSCTFSQRQGFITIQTPAGAVYEFSPVGDAPGNFVDAGGGPVYRQAGLGNDGQIFDLVEERIFVYWDTAPFSGSHSTPYANSDRRLGTLTANDPGAQINVRQSATIYSRAIAYGLPGDRIDILQCELDGDTPGSDLNWCRVQFVESGAIGWIRSDFIIFPSDGE